MTRNTLTIVGGRIAATLTGLSRGLILTTPAADDFAAILAGATDHYARNHAHTTRIDNVHCVEASTGHYLCSYRSTTAGNGSSCHATEARWTPDAESSFAVTLAGRAARCRTLREALHSLDY